MSQFGPGPDNSLLAAVAIASQDAASRIQAATVTSVNAAAAQRDVATIQGGFMVTTADIDRQARESVATIEARGRVDAAVADTAWHAVVAEIESAGRSAVASIQAGATTQAAMTAAQGDMAAATAHANATIAAATSQANATLSAAAADANSRTAAASAQANATMSAAASEAGARVSAADIEAGAATHGADQQLAGVNAHEAAETGRLNLKLAFAEDKWRTLLPIIEDALGVVGAVASGSGGSGGSGGGIGFHAQARPGPVMGFGAVIAAGATANLAVEDPVQMGTYWRRPASGPLRMGSGDTKTGGIGFASGFTVADAVAATQLPFISTSGVLTPAQVQAQVNAAYARNDAKTASEVAKLVEDMSGRGFSANSPILAALQVGLAGQNLRASLEAETQIRLEAAKLNAEAVFAGQKEVSDQFIKQEGVLLDHEKNAVTRTVGVLGAISQLIGSAL